MLCGQYGGHGWNFSRNISRRIYKPAFCEGIPVHHLFSNSTWLDITTTCPQIRKSKVHLLVHVFIVLTQLSETAHHPEWTCVVERLKDFAEVYDSCFSSRELWNWCFLTLNILLFWASKSTKDCCFHLRRPFCVWSTTDRWWTVCSKKTNHGPDHSTLSCHGTWTTGTLE